MGTLNHYLGPRQIARFEQAASLLPGLDPVEIYRFYIRHTQTGRKAVALADASRSYLQMLVETGRAVAYVSHARKALEDFAEELGSSDVSDYDAEAIRGHLYGLNYSPVTIRHRRGHLLCAFAWWAEQGWIDANPVEKVKRPNVVSGEPGILPVADMERLFRANEKVDPGICGILALGAFAGMRTSAIGRLDFAELDFGQRGDPDARVQDKEAAPPVDRGPAGKPLELARTHASGNLRPRWPPATAPPRRGVQAGRVADRGGRHCLREPQARGEGRAACHLATDAPAEELPAP